MDTDPRLIKPPRIRSTVKFSDREIAARAGRLKRIRLKLRLTQKQFAVQMGLKKATYYYRETGKVCPSDTEMILAELLNLIDNQKKARKHNRMYRNRKIKQDVLRLYLNENMSPEQIAARLGIRTDIAVWHIENLDFEEEDPDEADD